MVRRESINVEKTGSSEVSGVTPLRVTILTTKVLQASGVTQKTQSTFVIDDPSEILEALVGLKDVRGVHYRRRASDVELSIE